MRKMIGLGALAMALLVAPAAPAQQILPVSLEVRGGLGFPMGDFPTRGLVAQEAVESGDGFALRGTYNLIPLLGVYAGFERYSFGVDEEEAAGPDLNFVDSGFSAGAQLSLPLAMLAGVSPWIRGGAIFHILDYELEEIAGVEANTSSDRTLGFEAGAGVDIPLGQVLSFTPGVTYRSYEPQFDGLTDGERLSYLAVEMGLRVRL